MGKIVVGGVNEFVNYKTERMIKEPTYVTANVEEKRSNCGMSNEGVKNAGEVQIVKEKGADCRHDQPKWRERQRRWKRRNRTVVMERDIRCKMKPHNFR